MTGNQHRGQEPSRSRLEAERLALGNVGRRRFLIGGVATGAPILMTLASRSAFADQQCSISGTLSGNLSRPKSQCEGCDAHTWACNPSSWPSACNPGHYNPITCYGQGTPSDWSFCDGQQLKQLSQSPYKWSKSQISNYQYLACQGTLYNYAVFNSGPSTCNPYPYSENGGGGNPPMTLMQALWSSNVTESTYAACILNAAKWGSSFGYTLPQMQQLIAKNNGQSGFVTDLQKLFNRA